MHCAYLVWVSCQSLILKWCHVNLFVGRSQNSVGAVTGIFNGPSDFYRYQVDTGVLHPDENQAVVVEHMQSLYNDLITYEHRSPSKSVFFKVEYGDLISLSMSFAGSSTTYEL